MKKIVFILMYFAAISSTAEAQNLVPNNSFDTYTIPPNDIAQVCRATGWNSPSGLCESGNGGTPDYFHTSGSGPVDPPACAWATVSPHTGGGMEGFGTYFFVPVDWREYISCQLSSPLVAGTPYEVSFWLTNGSNSLYTIGTNNIGAAFTSSPLTQSVTSPINVIPQVEITQVVYSATWQQFSFTFIPSAAYQYVTIGNFRNDAATTIQPQTSNANSGAYYYIDDVVVQPASILPIEWGDFQAVLKDEHSVELTWNTISEWNNDFFSIERSQDGNSFSSIAITGAADNAMQGHSYHYVDNLPLAGFNYYRIAQQDLDGSHSYSPVKAVEVKGFLKENEIMVFPNPAIAGDMVNIQLPGEYATLAQVLLLNETGRVIITTDFSVVADAGMLQLAIPKVSPGIYILKLIAAKENIILEKLLIL